MLKPNPIAQNECNKISQIHTGIICNDVRYTKIPKVKLGFLFKSYFNRFGENTFLHDIYYSDLSTQIPDVKLACEYFSLNAPVYL